MAKKKKAAPKARKTPVARAGSSRQATDEEQAKGVPANGYVILFRVFTRKEHDELVKLKEQIAAKLPENTRANWPAVVTYAMREACA